MPKSQYISPKDAFEKGFIEFEDGTSPDLNAGFFWYLKSSTGGAQDLTICSTGT